MNVTEKGEEADNGTRSRAGIEAVCVYGAFCGLSFASRFVPMLFVFVMLFGIGFPVLWDRLTHERGGPGFSRQRLGSALMWGLGSGLAFGMYTWAVFGAGREAPPLLGVQLAIGVPVWLLLMSPFQEFFFRGWLQPRAQKALGRWGGLLVASVAFALWHYFPPLEGTMTSTLPISTPVGALSALALGLLMGYVYDRTHNMVAPWLGHALAGLALVAAGVMTFLQYNP